MAPTDEDQDIIHASCVAIGRAGVLICGPSGAGKSAMALELMSRGAQLVADDRTIVTRVEQGLRASCPETIAGRIEARGVGVLTSEYQPSAILKFVVDLSEEETDRLPHFRSTSILGHDLPLLHRPVHGHFPAAILQYLKGGRCE